MKKRHLIAFLCLGWMASSCLTTVELKLYTLPEDPLPQHIKTLGLLDHSQGKDSSLESDLPFVSVQLPGDGRQVDESFLSYACILGADLMAATSADSLQTQKIEMQLRRPLPDSFPPPLPPEIVRSLCEQYAVDGLLVLEYYHVRFSDMPREAGLGERFKQGTLRAGWRVYDHKNEAVVFEDVFAQELPYLTWWNDQNPGKSGEALRRSAQVELGNLAGMTIIKILSRTHTSDSRRFYAGKFGPNDEIAARMKKAGELALGNQWEAAMELWNPVASHEGYGKGAAKAAYNMAVGCEHIGNLPLAIQWAQMSARMGCSEANVYLELLQFRAGI